MPGTPHPSPEILADFVRGELSRRDRNWVVRHLLGRCESCGAVAEALAAPILRPSARRLPPGGEDAYEFPVRRAIANVLHRVASVGAARSQAESEVASLAAGRGLPGAADPSLPEDLLSLARAESFLRQARRQRQVAPEPMLVAAGLGLALALRLDAAAHAEGAVEDLRAELWAEVAYARRLLGDLPGGSAALVAAARASRRGGNDPVLLLRLAELAVAQLNAERRFSASRRLLGQIFRAHVSAGRRHLAGKALVLEGICLGLEGEAPSAVERLSSGLAWIDGEAEPRLAFAAVHNLLWFAAEAGRIELAGRLLPQARPLYERHAEPIDRLKLRCLEGRIACGLGALDEAERAFAELKTAYAERGMPYLEALLGLDLAAVRLRQGRTAEVRELIAETLLAFRALGVGREAVATVLLLQRTLRAERDALDTLDALQTLRAAAARLERLERAPRVRAESPEAARG
ncbi:MAG TPA: hypothetical protein VN783_12080 [Thermoanaerobaculia bacterium]|nr:hypothetical protein [Thermoanaerobaculia bacterium]